MALAVGPSAGARGFLASDDGADLKFHKKISSRSENCKNFARVDGLVSARRASRERAPAANGGRRPGLGPVWIRLPHRPGQDARGNRLPRGLAARHHNA